MPADIPGIFLAAVAGIGFGIVLGPEAPLIGLGGALGALLFKIAARDAPPEAGQLIASSGIFAAISFLFGSPVLAAVLLIEVAGLDRAKTTMILIPGLLAAGIGSLVAVGMGSWTGVDTSNISLQLISLPDFARPTFVDFLWTVPLAAALAIGLHLVVRIGRGVEPRAIRKPFVVLPVVGADRRRSRPLLRGAHPTTASRRSSSRVRTRSGRSSPIRRAGRSARWRCCWCSRASPTASRSAPSAAAPSSRR